MYSIQIQKRGGSTVMVVCASLAGAAYLHCQRHQYLRKWQRHTAAAQQVAVWVSARAITPTRTVTQCLQTFALIRALDQPAECYSS